MDPGLVSLLDHARGEFQLRVKSLGIFGPQRFLDRERPGLRVQPPHASHGSLRYRDQ